MIVLKISDGFGNQLFQYACGYAVSRRLNTDLVLDTSILATNSCRKFELDKLSIEYEKILSLHGNAPKCRKVFNRYLKQKKIKKHFQTFTEDNAYIYDKNIRTIKDDTYLQGYWQSEKYFREYKEELQTLFTPRYEQSHSCKKFVEEVESCNSVAIHICRGDYQATGICVVQSYYHQAIERMKACIVKPVFYVFSDDINVAKNILKKEEGDFIFVQYECDNLDNLTLDDFFIMKTCKHQIIANSSYSWWAAWLNENESKIVICPEYKQWTGEFYPEDWILIKCSSGGLKKTLGKIERKLKGKIVAYCKTKAWYFKIYPSYWHMDLRHRFSNVSRRVENSEGTDEKNDVKVVKQYLSARPNPGAGIGHQMANWIAGYWYAEKFNLKYTHMNFSTDKWENFLGFYRGEIPIGFLKNHGYKVVRLPLFTENTEEEKIVRDIVESYPKEKIVFLCEQDQFYHDQFGVMGEIQNKFYSAPLRNGQKLKYCIESYNLAIHVRRGDILQKNGKENPNLTMRFQSNEYFKNALITAMNFLEKEKNIPKGKIHIYLFSQGKPEDYQEFKEFDNLHFCFDMGAQDSFLHMVYADALITSKSSFSYKPALLNRGIKFCPADFWHGYPDNENWILLDENGEIKK